jgi:hypothetical protein
MSTKKVKALKRYSTYSEDGDIISKEKLLCDSEPVYILPRTKESYEKLVEQLAEATFIHHCNGFAMATTWETTDAAVKTRIRDSLQAALIAIGIKQPK